LAPADPGTVTVVLTSSASPHESANTITGASPAHDTRFASSNFIESRDNS